MAELTEAWWKKNKAKTLLKEPLTDALKVYEKMEKARRAEPNQDNYDAVETAIMKGILPALKETKAKCNPSLHKETIGHIDALMKLTQQQLDIIKKHYDNMKAYLKAATAQAETTKKVWATAKAKMTPANFNAYLKEIKAMEKLAETFAETRFYAGPLGQLHQKARGLAEVAENASKSLGDPAADKKKVMGMLTELDKGYDNMKGWLVKMKPPK